MADKGGLVVTSESRVEETRWLQTLKRKENAFVCFFPKTDRLLLIQQLLQDKKFLKSVLGAKERYFFQILDLESHNVEEKSEMCWRIADQLNYTRSDKMTWDQWITYLRRNKVTLVLILPQAEKFLSSSVLSYLSSIVDTYSPHVITLCLFEVDIAHSSLMRTLPNSTRLYQNIYHYPLYNADDSHRFIHYLEDRWDKRISRSMATKIVQYCGGHLWIMKEAVRQVISGNADPFRTESMQFRLRMVYEFMSSSEQSLLAKLETANKILTQEEKDSLRYFRKMNFVDNHDRCTIGLYKEFVTKNAQIKGEFMVRNGNILLNGVPINQLFSSQERRVIRELIEKRGQVVARDQIASIIWPTNTQENYSDWAIDQLIARLRKRLSELSLPPNLLQAVRGKGYLLNLPSA